MTIYTLNADNCGLFTPVLSPEMSLSLLSASYAGLIAIESQNGQEYAQGALVFEIVESHDEEAVAVMIRWLYVSEECRGQGTGTALLNEMLRITGAIGIYDALCDLPLSEECDIICAFLEDYGFEFHFSELYEVMIPIMRIRGLAARLPRNAGNADVRPITAVSNEDFAAFVREMKAIPEVLADLPEDIAGYEEAVSCVSLTENGAIRGLLLVGESTDGCPTVSLLRMRAGSTSDLSSMLTFSMLAAANVYPPNSFIRVNCWYEGAAAILNKLFPDLELALVRRGYFSILEDEEGLE